MEDTKHTPGSWHMIEGNKHHGPYVECDVFGDICNCYVISHDKHSRCRSTPYWFQADRAEANARLIAAAPDLLEALEGLRDQQDRMVLAGGADGSMGNDMILSFAKSNQVLWEKAEAAIAKATGSEESA